MRRRSDRLWIGLVVIGVLAVTLAGCRTPAEEHPAITAVEELLQLRRADSRDPEAYAKYFLESDLATALAEGEGEPEGTPRIPQWEKPYLSEETTEAVSVAVVWKADPAFEDWPAVNVFWLSLVGGQWVVTDAVEASEVPAPLREESK